MQTILIDGLALPIRDAFAPWDAYVFQEGLVDDTYRLKHLPAGWSIKTVLDLGVNIGTFRVALARLASFDPAGYVGFEASAENLAHAKLVGAAAGLAPDWYERIHNKVIAGDFASVGFDKTDPNPGAWGARFGAAPAGEGPLEHTSIHQVLLADFPQGLDLLKTDIEGGEYDVLTALQPEHLHRISLIVGEWHEQFFPRGGRWIDCVARLQETHEVRCIPAWAGNTQQGTFFAVRHDLVERFVGWFPPPFDPLDMGPVTAWGVRGNLGGATPPPRDLPPPIEYDALGRQKPQY